MAQDQAGATRITILQALYEKVSFRDMDAEVLQAKKALSVELKKQLESAYDEAFGVVLVCRCAVDVDEKLQAQKEVAVEKVLHQCILQDRRNIPKTPFTFNGAGEISFSFA
jgi:hypothetical protein